MDLPNITIDDINFRLIGYNPQNQIVDRDALKIISTLQDGTSYELYLYQSETSLGFWRLGCFDRGQLYKGLNDYIQQTFIHFTLQEFINKNISRVKDIRFINTHPELNSDIYKRFNTEYPEILESSFPICYSKLPFYKHTLTHYIPSHTNNTARMIQLEPFMEFDKDVTKRCGSWKGSPEEYLKTISERFSELYELNIESIQFLYNDLYEYNNVYGDGTTPVKLNIIFNIFCCVLIPKRGGPNLYLYYTIYNIIDGSKVQEESLMVDKHYFPLFLTTNTNITPYGTFENYVLSAGYICKLFEYVKQSTIGKVISKEHRYIGYIYNDLFPFNIIKSLQSH